MNTLFEQAKKFIPAGVNSPVRAFNNVGGDPIFIKKAKSAYIYDTQDTKYIDFCLSWGVMILGHAHPKVVNAVKEAVALGSSFGCATEKEVQLAEMIVNAVPSIEQVRCVSSGTEATMSALRLARGFTNRDLIVKFEGCYHGHADYLLVAAGSGVSQIPKASSAGVPDGAIKDIISVPYNDLDAIDDVFKNNENKIAAIIVEPVAANMGLVLPENGFLQGLRDIADKQGTLLIFDEVISGFRLGLGGAQKHFGITPDLTCLGKIIGGGFPVGAFGGRRDIMQHLAPIGNVYQAGTLSGNPIAMTAGITTLNILGQEGFYTDLHQRCDHFLGKLQGSIDASSSSILLQKIGSMFTLFFTEKKKLVNYEEVQSCNMEAFGHFFHKALKAGVYLAPSGYETHFISTMHRNNDFLSLQECLGDADTAID